MTGRPQEILKKRYRLLPNHGLAAAALEHDIDPGLLKRGSTQFEKKRGYLRPVPARDLKPLGAGLLGEDGQGNAQGCLTKPVLLIDFCALADQELDEVSNSLIGGRVQRSPAELSRGIHVSAVVDQESCRLDRQRSLFD